MRVSRCSKGLLSRLPGGCWRQGGGRHVVSAARRVHPAGFSSVWQTGGGGGGSPARLERAPLPGAARSFIKIALGEGGDTRDTAAAARGPGVGGRGGGSEQPPDPGEASGCRLQPVPPAAPGGRSCDGESQPTFPSASSFGGAERRGEEEEGIYFRSVAYQSREEKLSFAVLGTLLLVFFLEGGKR